MSENSENKSINENSIVMLRTTQQHHVQLSMMADQKASFLMGASFVVLSILAGHMFNGKASLLMLFLAFILLLVSIFAILSIMPRHKHRHVVKPSDNLLFFGIFAQMPYPEFCEKMYEKMADEEKMYDEIMKDIYSMGKVLNDKKYRYLSISYKVFFVGLVLSPFVALAEYFFL